MLPQYFATCTHTHIYSNVGIRQVFIVGKIAHSQMFICVGCSHHASCHVVARTSATSSSCSLGPLQIPSLGLRSKQSWEIEVSGSLTNTLHTLTGCSRFLHTLFTSGEFPSQKRLLVTYFHTL